MRQNGCALTMMCGRSTGSRMLWAALRPRQHGSERAFAATYCSSVESVSAPEVSKLAKLRGRR